MRKTPANRPYKSLAAYYDRLFPSARSWGDEARGAVLGGILPNIRSACDLACGTGTTALELARGGVEVFGVDLSPTMCRVARKKARAAGLDVRILQADMRKFRLPRQVDLVTCEFDALNHVPRKEDLHAVARAVASALRPGGYFYFDVNNRLSFEKIWPLTWWIEVPGLIGVMRGGHDKLRGKAFAIAELFVKKGRYWQRFSERVEEVCWTRDEIRAALRQAGFDHIRSRDARSIYKEDPMLRPGFRTFYLARKRPG